MFRTSSVMGKLQIILAVFFGGVSCCHFGVSGSAVEVTVRPGDNITLYCDYRPPTGVYIVWFRNCSHEKQPPLVMNALVIDGWDNLHLPPRYKLVKNVSSESYDLLIMNVSGSDEGFYYCATKEVKVKDTSQLTEDIYRYSTITAKLTLYPTDLNPDMNQTLQACGWCWKLLFFVCPAVSVLSALLSSLLVYRFCQKTEKNLQHDEDRCDTRHQTRRTQDENVCYAALEIRQTSRRPKRKSTQRTQSSDFSVYSGINASVV